jgi:hypothetical protein
VSRDRGGAAEDGSGEAGRGGAEGEQRDARILCLCQPLVQNESREGGGEDNLELR